MTQTLILAFISLQSALPVSTPNKKLSELQLTQSHSHILICLPPATYYDFQVVQFGEARRVPSAPSSALGHLLHRSDIGKQRTTSRETRILHHGIRRNRHT